MPRNCTVQFRDPNNNYEVINSSLTFTPELWSFAAIGGCDQAEIAVSGAKQALADVIAMLGYHAQIRSPRGTVLWHGFVHEVELVIGNLIVGLTLETEFNRIAVTYVRRDAGGLETQERTDWQDDTITQGIYGVRELIVPHEGDQTGAARFRAAELVRRRHPKPSFRTAPGDSGARLFCMGAWHRLGWQYYAQGAGLVENIATGPGEEQLGASYVATTIRFAAQDDIYDTAGLTADGLGALATGDKFFVAGAANAANNGEFTLKSTELSGGEGHLETVDKDRVTEAAGATVTITRTGTRVDRIAQSFTLPEDVEDWTVASISIRAQRVGNPSDDLVCELRADSSGNPGTLLDTQSIDGGDLSEDMGWVEFHTSNADALVYGTTYWIVIRRSGANSLANYYIVDIDEDAAYGGGIVKTYAGSSYATRTPAADMPFRIVGSEETTLQLQKMVEANEFFGSGSVILDAVSDIYTWQYRDGDGNALDEIFDLLAQGTDAGERLLAVAETDEQAGDAYRVIVAKQPVADDADWLLNENGTITYEAGGDAATIEPGGNLAGRWLRLNVFPLADMLGTKAVWVERVEWNAEDDVPRIETEENERVWNLIATRPG